jgi:hypothetical protein
MPCIPINKIHVTSGSNLIVIYIEDDRVNAWRWLLLQPWRRFARKVPLH